MSTTNQTAKQVTQELLEKIISAQQVGNFDDYVAHFTLPHEVQTFEGTRKVETAADVRQIFDGIISAYRKANITKVIRNCVEASYLDGETISATHETRLLRRTELVSEPYPVHAVIRLINGQWRIHDSEYAIPDAIGVGDILLGRSPRTEND